MIKLEIEQVWGNRNEQSFSDLCYTGLDCAKFGFVHSNGRDLVSFEFRSVEVLRVFTAPFFSQYEFSFAQSQNTMVIGRVKNSPIASELCNQNPWAGFEASELEHFIIFASDRAAEVFCRRGFINSHGVTSDIQTAMAN